MNLQVEIEKQLGNFTLNVSLQTREDQPEVLGLLGASG